MENLSTSFASLLSSPELQESGLPFWLFYLLLSIILLLVFISFLRNRDLRQKISYALAGPRRKLERLRLQVILKREEEKKNDLLRRLGELGRLRWPNLEELKGLPDEVKSLEEKNSRLQEKWHRLYHEQERLKQEKKKLLTQTDSRGDLLEKREELEKNISILEKNRNDIQEEIIATDELLVPYYETIGKLLYKLRPDQEDLDYIYFQIDSIEKKIKETKEQLKKF